MDGFKLRLDVQSLGVKLGRETPWNWHRKPTTKTTFEPKSECQRNLDALGQGENDKMQTAKQNLQEQSSL